MSTQVKHFALAKVATAVVAVAMISGLLFAFATPRAQAVTLSELIELFIALDIIAEDKQDEARAVLENQGGDTSGGSTGGSSTCSTTFTRNLTVGATGADVKALQMLLNGNPATQVASVGAGSPGAETMYFGPATKAAVAKFQNMYASEVLAPVGLTSGTGYFGASTRAKANMMCTSGGNNGGGTPTTGGGTPPPPPPGPGGDDDDDDDDDNGSSSSLGGGEASLEDFDSLGSPSNEDLEEGDENVAVFGFEFDVEDADAQVKRVDVAFQSQTLTKEDEPWNSIDEVSLWVDGEKVAEANADDEDDWDDQGSDVYEIRLTGIDDAIFEEGDTAEMLVGVTVNGNIDDSDLDQTWQVWIPAEGLRAIDGAGIDQYTGSAAETKDFNIEKVGGDAELDVSEDSSSPDASTIKVDENDTTDDVVLNVANFEADDGDVTLDELVFQVENTGSTTVTYDRIFSDIWVEIDGERHDDVTVADGSASTTNVTVELDDDIEIKEDEELEVKIVADLLKQDGSGSSYEGGEQIRAGFTTANVTTIGSSGAEDDGGNDLTGRTNGTAIGEFHTLIASGIFAEIVSITETVNRGDNNSDDLATFEFRFDVTAFEDTAYIASTTGAVSFTVFQDGVASTTLTLANAQLTGSFNDVNADETVSGNYRVDDNQTEEFVFKVNLNTVTDGNYKVQLDTVNFGSTDGAPTANSHAASPDNDFESEEELVNA